MSRASRLIPASMFTVEQSDDSADLSSIDYNYVNDSRDRDYIFSQCDELYFLSLLIPVNNIIY